jgi:hypothetical protein
MAAAAAAQSTVPTGTFTLLVETHKKNFRTQHGIFSDMESNNIVTWVKHADSYRRAHMIESLEMCQIIIHNISGEPKRKVQRMLDVPGDEYPNADHWCQQPLQEEQKWSPYKHRVVGSAAVVDVANPANNRDEVLDVLAVPEIQPKRYQPEIPEDKCLRFYLLNIYKKKIDMAASGRFLDKFKKQKPRQTCSNFLDELVINYDTYSHQRWTAEQLQTNGNYRKADMLQLALDGLCTEFTAYLDYTQTEIDSFATLETEVYRWQRSAVAGKNFTKNCIIASENGANSSASAITQETASVQQDAPLSEEQVAYYAAIDAQSALTISPTVSSAGGRGRGITRGAGRGARGRGGRGAGRGASRGGQNSPAGGRGHQQSRDPDGGFHNYCQNTNGELQLSPHGHPYCNYCGIPSHKREHCTVKMADRKKGLNRSHHPDRGTMLSNNQIKKQQVAVASAANGVPAPIPQQWLPWQSPWQTQYHQPPPQQFVNGPPALPATFMQPATRDFLTASGHTIDTLVAQARAASNPTTATTSSAQFQSGTNCPYNNCNTVLHNPQAAQEHLQQFHGQLPALGHPAGPP